MIIFKRILVGIMIRKKRRRGEGKEETLIVNCLIFGSGR